MGATRVGVIAEGPIDQLLIDALLQRIASDRAQFGWPVIPEDAVDLLPVRKRGYGGVLDAVRRIVRVLDRPEWFSRFAFIVIVLDARTKAAQHEVRKLIRGKDGFILGVAIEEIEAWWLGDRRNVLAWADLTGSLPTDARYAEDGYTAEKDPDPKKTLDEITVISRRMDRRYGRGNSELARDFALLWRDTAYLKDIEKQCPTGFAPFCGETTEAFTRTKASLNRLF